jgi:hypothetical protein
LLFLPILFCKHIFRPRIYFSFPLRFEFAPCSRQPGLSKEQFLFQVLAPAKTLLTLIILKYLSPPFLLQPSRNPYPKGHQKYEPGSHPNTNKLYF